MKQMQSSRANQLLIPAPIKRGDAVGVVAASGPPAPDLLEAGLEFLVSKGFRIVRGCHLLERNDYLAGTDDQRCSDLNAMLRDPEVRAIAFARGGYGTMRLLDSIDRDAITSDPKILLGMSDVTALQLSLHRTCNLVTFAGPMIAGQVASGLDRVSEEWLVKALTEPIGGRNLWPNEGANIRVLRPGNATGVLLGGCLSLITAILGTDHQPDFTGRILLLEDVNESLYRIDRMLTQLKLSGALEGIVGLVLGHFTGPNETDLAQEVEQLVMEFTQDNPMPVISRFPHGHCLPNLTLPLGVPVEMNTQLKRLLVQLGPN